MHAASNTCTSRWTTPKTVYKIPLSCSRRYMGQSGPCLRLQEHRNSWEQISAHGNLSAMEQKRPQQHRQRVRWCAVQSALARWRLLCRPVRTAHTRVPNSHCTASSSAGFFASDGNLGAISLLQTMHIFKAQWAIYCINIKKEVLRIVEALWLYLQTQPLCKWVGLHMSFVSEWQHFLSLLVQFSCKSKLRWRNNVSTLGKGVKSVHSISKLLCNANKINGPSS